MTLIVLEGFDALNTGNAAESLQDKWHGTEAAHPTVSSSAVTPFSQGFSVHLGDNNDSGVRYYLSDNFIPDITSGVVGFHWRTSDLLENEEGFFEIWGTGTEASSDAEISIRVMEHGHIGLRNGNILRAESNYVLHSNTWYHVELQYYISDSVPANTVILRIDGEDWIRLDAGTDTKWNPLTTVDFFMWRGSPTSDRYLDDFYFLTLTGIEPKSMLSSSRIQTVFPTGDGNIINFIGNDGNQINNYQQVDEASPDEDVTYNTISSDGRDQYNFQHLSGVVTTIHGIELSSRARTNQSSPVRGWSNFAFVSGVNYDQPSGNLTGLVYSYFSDVLGRNPNTNGEWTQNSVQDAQFGVKYIT